MKKLKSGNLAAGKFPLPSVRIGNGGKSGEQAAGVKTGVGAGGLKRGEQQKRAFGVRKKSKGRGKTDRSRHSAETRGVWSWRGTGGRTKKMP